MNNAVVIAGAFGGVGNGLDLAGDSQPTKSLQDDLVDRYREAIGHYSKVSYQILQKYCRAKIELLQRYCLSRIEYGKGTEYLGLQYWIGTAYL